MHNAEQMQRVAAVHDNSFRQRTFLNFTTRRIAPGGKASIYDDF